VEWCGGVVGSQWRSPGCGLKGSMHIVSFRFRQVKKEGWICLVGRAGTGSPRADRSDHETEGRIRGEAGRTTTRRGERGPDEEGEQSEDGR
jgi:hypothetical protein